MGSTEIISYLCVMNESDSIKNGVIFYKDKILEEVEKRVYQSYADGLSFIN